MKYAIKIGVEFQVMNMKKIYFIQILLICFSQSFFAQETIVSGIILHNISNEPLSEVEVSIEETTFLVTTGVDGLFSISDKNLPEGPQYLLIRAEGFISQELPIIIYSDEKNEMAPIFLSEEFSSLSSEVGIISLFDDQLDSDDVSYSVPGFLQGTQDVFLNAAVYDFSSAFFNPRGFGSENGKLLINGLEMNTFYSGRPVWTNWGGMNDIMRNREFSSNISSGEYAFGDLAGTTNIVLRASNDAKGGKLSFSNSNRTYQGMVTGKYSSGLQKNGWAYSVLLGRRFAQEGYIDGTLYDANSFFLSVEKIINDSHSLNFTGFYTPNRRGGSSAQTQEVFDLKGKKYNSYWGFQDGTIRNSRIIKVAEPVFMLNYLWSVSDKTELQANAGFQIGFQSHSRLGYDNAPNPDPAYYQNLPSYFLGLPDGPDYINAEKARMTFIHDGQIDWYNLYETNIFYGGTSRYYLYEDRIEDTQGTINVLLHTEMNTHINFTAAGNFRKLHSHVYAKMRDLLGGNGYLDVDVFKTGSAAENNLNQPNRIVTKGDAFKYNYKFDVSSYDAFVQADFSYSKFDFFFSGKIENTHFQRNGLYRNGSFPDGNDSFGKSEKLNFLTYGGKAGLVYKFSGKHGIEMNGAYFTDAPSLQNSFSNSRQNNRTVIGIKPVKKTSIDLNYLFRSAVVQGRVTGYYTAIEDLTDISFFYADGISTDDRSFKSAFIQEILTGIHQEHFGLEMGAEAQITNSIKLKTAVAYGQNIYKNNPNLYITSDVFANPQFYGESYLKNYKLPGSPQQAYQLGFEYRNPKFWWFGITGNYFSNTYINISPLTRTKNFYRDATGIPFEDYQEDIAKKLLKQEKFTPYFLVNAVGGKSWRINNYTFGFLAVVNNVLNTEFKTGGYEQGRNSNYHSLFNDVNKNIRVFGPKYWYGYGTNYSIKVYVRF